MIFSGDGFPTLAVNPALQECFSRLFGLLGHHRREQNPSGTRLWILGVHRLELILRNTRLRRNIAQRNLHHAALFSSLIDGVGFLLEAGVPALSQSGVSSPGE